MRYSDLDQLVAEHGTQHNLDMPLKQAIIFLNRKDFNYGKQQSDSKSSVKT
jgi:hypothetical protein